ncbi:MAG: hypothetical protein ACREUA_00315 [Burkholderiales bacterium]
MPEKFALVDMARLLRVSLATVQQWTTTPFLLRDASGVPVLVPRLKTYRVPWKSRVRVFVLRVDLLHWLEATGRLYQPGNKVWLGS